MRRRSWSLRAKIISLLLVPLATLVAMWGLATAVTLGPGLDLLDAQSDLDNIAAPGQRLVAELQAERRATVAYLASDTKNASPLLAQRDGTDAAVREFRRLAGGEDALGAASEQTPQRVADLLARLDGLPSLRGEVDRGSTSRSEAFASYTEIVGSGHQLFHSLVLIADETLSLESLALIELSRSREALSQEDAVVRAALAAGPLTAADLARVIQLIGIQRYLYARTVSTLHESDQADYATVSASAAFTQLRRLEDTMIASARIGERAPITATNWQRSIDAVSADLAALELRSADRLVERSKPAVLGVFGRIALAGLLGLIAVIVTIIATVRIARSLIKRLAGLRQAALELAIDRLPRVVARLRQGEEVDVANEAPALPYGEDEIGQVGHAFNELQRTAVNSAIDEANVRRGLNEVFLNIARRSQTLLHRQLSILDRMERRADDPTELEDLFRVDHLSTRMRRHAEALVILAGAAPGRGWRNPVPIVDILRGAVSEVEDYARVSIRPMPEIALVGRAVGDVIHLLAELIENATSFSPPHTRVNVGGEMVSHGFAVEIEDRGLGMPAAAMAEFNARLTDPPEFDPANSAQLGLFVVARLAARHGVRVQLRSSPYGGVTAVALIPDELVVSHATVGGGRPMEAMRALPAAKEEDANDSRRFREAPIGELRAIAAPPPAAPPTFASGPATSGPAISDPVTFSPAAPAAAVPSQSRRRRSATAVPPRHARQEIIEPDANGDGLPRRIRQTNLAPQLHDYPAPSGVSQSGDIATPGPASRTPEELRAMMTSFQSGMNRGRRDAEARDHDDRNGRAPGREVQ
jgi:signal transduction histidine kinase